MCLQIELKNRSHQYDTLFLVSLSVSSSWRGGEGEGEGGVMADRDGEREQRERERRWDFSPLVFFFFSLLFIAAEQPSVIC